MSDRLLPWAAGAMAPLRQKKDRAMNYFDESARQRRPHCNYTDSYFILLQRRQLVANTPRELFEYASRTMPLVALRIHLCFLEVRGVMAQQDECLVIVAIDDTLLQLVFKLHVNTAFNVIRTNSSPLQSSSAT